MALNPKIKKTEKLVQELSRLTDESPTAAVTEAVRERLERVRTEQGSGLADRLTSIGKDCAAHLKSGPGRPTITATCCTTIKVTPSVR
jgi:antitoxin VapB